ncbi:patatin-like phospholipase family protein [Clavibacter michiganensis]|uniref:patatin-like phospholipase family protein n=1 Tax=Clavibacter michiganensis TaxID=28447 RepID=UPI001366425B|nr:patatin-like phospholipase family protein [Clavibacter michiganensis]MBW8027134.1 phospholipase [Clavibacter michiganensis subsp. michiganensis]MWJ35773.1 phospholipase [Clavibacter michiganensis subsp. michiganensis]MWJ80685.1 phospholipase [Clavibacter michiganensis subsp. michiganensis]
MTGTERDTTTPTRGLVLGGGGVAGIAWETGLLSGLIAAGIDVGAADTVVGTSAGSVVAINLRAGAIQAAYDEHFVDVAGMAEPMGSRDLSRTVEVIGEGVASTEGEIPTRQRIGEFALEEYDPEVDDAASVERIGQLLPIRDWPERDLRITAVDAGTGRFTVFDKDSGADLVRASAASCAVPGVFPPVTIDGRPYMDGGMRSGTNADVVADHERILVIACGPEAPQSGMGPTLSTVVQQLRGRADVLVIQADAESTAAFGENSLLLSTRKASAEAGRRQGERLAEEIRAFWG